MGKITQQLVVICLADKLHDVQGTLVPIDRGAAKLQLLLAAAMHAALRTTCRELWFQYISGKNYKYFSGRQAFLFRESGHPGDDLHGSKSLELSSLFCWSARFADC